MTPGVLSLMAGVPPRPSPRPRWMEPLSPKLRTGRPVLASSAYNHVPADVKMR